MGRRGRAHKRFVWIVAGDSINRLLFMKWINIPRGQMANDHNMMIRSTYFIIAFGRSLKINSPVIIIIVFVVQIEIDFLLTSLLGSVACVVGFR